MAQRGRPRKIKEELTVPAQVDYAKALKQFEQEQQIQLEELYKTLAKLKYSVDLALTHIGFIDSCEHLAEAAFKAGRAFGPLDKANDELEEILDKIYGNNDFDHYNDILDN
jgi:hypothetical protein